MKKAVSGLMLVLLLICVLPSVFNVQSVEAAISPYSPADAISIMPSTATIRVNQTVTVEIIVTNITECACICFWIDYQDSILECVGSTFDTDPTNPLSPTQMAPAPADRVDNDASVPGSVKINTVWKMATPTYTYTGDSVVAEITFKGKTTGNSSILFTSHVHACDTNGDDIYFSERNNSSVAVVVPSHDIGITSVTPSKTVVGEGFNVHIDVAVFNYGNNTENFNVTAHANSTIFDALTNITISCVNSSTVTLTWNSTSLPKGNYNINVYATPVLGELITEDNTYTYWLLITIVGDVDGDRDVDVGDQRQVQNTMFCLPGHINWDPNMDIDSDLDVDVGDQRKQQLHMFESW